jgi:hypothetical protein
MNVRKKFDSMDITLSVCEEEATFVADHQIGDHKMITYKYSSEDS